MVSVRNPKKTFERLIGRLLDGMLVPFIGAGVSIGAINREGYPGLTDTKKMCERVIQAIQEKCGTKRESRCSSCVVRREIENGLENKKSFDKLCELWEWSCAENRESKENARCVLVLDIIKIQKFTNMKPTKAHFYLAFLAREGLIDEVITTNYDNCIEEAYCKTFGSLLEVDKSPALVIDSLENYRIKGGRRFVNDNKKQRFLKIYKINGCAGNLKGLKDSNDCEKQCINKEKCKNILLTERDLQDWGRRSWARELFRDRLRSRTLLFSGFGSEEPQVRHTVLQVCEEFTFREGENKIDNAHSSEDVWGRPNAPFIVAFEKTLSFTQTQILQAYAQVAGLPSDSERLLENSLLGSDVAFFGCNCPLTKRMLLPADLFWKRLFQAAYWRLLRDACGSGSAVVSFLLPVLPCVNALLTEVIEWFVPKNNENYIFGRFPKMLDLNEDNEEVIPLARWVKQVRTAQLFDITNGWYYPLVDHPVIIPILLILIYLFIGCHCSKISWQKLKGMVGGDNYPLGLFIDGRYLVKSSGVRIYIAHRDVAEQLPGELSDYRDEDVTVVIQIVINSWRSTVRRIRFHNKNECKVKVVTVRQISLLELFDQVRSVPEAKRSFRKKLQETFSLPCEARDSVRERSRLLRVGGDEDGR